MLSSITVIIITIILLLFINSLCLLDSVQLNPDFHKVVYK